MVSTRRKTGHDEGCGRYPCKKVGIHESKYDFFGKTVLCIGAHPDDIELGCGALIADIITQTRVVCVTLSDNQKNPLHTNLVAEHYASMSILGVQKEHVILHDFTTRRLKESRQEILEVMIDLNKRFQPEVVLVHTAKDIHQDHQTVTEEALRLSRNNLARI